MGTWSFKMARWRRPQKAASPKKAPSELDTSISSGGSRIRTYTIEDSGLDSEDGDPMHTRNLDPSEIEVQEEDCGSTSSLEGRNPRQSQFTTNPEADRGRVQIIREMGVTAWEVKMIRGLKKCVEIKEQVVKRVGMGMVQLGGVLFLMIMLGLWGQKLALTGPGCEVKAFLDEAGLGEFYEVFMSEKYERLEDLINITDEQDLIDLNMQKRAERRRFLRHADARRTKELMNHETTMLMAVLWVSSFLVVAIVVGLSVSLYFFQEARRRIGFFCLWGCVMAWHRVRMYYRLWLEIDVKKRQVLNSPAMSPLAPSPSANPPVPRTPEPNTLH